MFYVCNKISFKQMSVSKIIKHTCVDLPNCKFQIECSDNLTCTFTT